MKKAKYEAVSFGTNSCKAFIEEKYEFDAPWHYHPEYELTLILRGKGIRYLGNTIENFEEYDLILIGPNVPHCWKNTVSIYEKASAVVVQWKENLLDTEWSHGKEFAHIRNLLKLSEKGLKFDSCIARSLKDKFIALTTLPPFKKMILLLEILNDLSQSHADSLLSHHKSNYNLNNIDNERISRINSYIQHHFNEKITLKDIASQVNMTEEYFSRYFKRMMKKTFFDFLGEYRINVACQLLIETDMQVNQICYCCGYESIPFFYKQFKKIKKYSPLAYKLQYQGIFK